MAELTNKGYSLDLNTATGYNECGMVNQNTQNKPSSAEINVGVYAVLRAKFTGDDPFCFQLLYSYYGNLFVRLNWGGEWHGWKKIL